MSLTNKQLEDATKILFDINAGTYLHIITASASEPEQTSIYAGDASSLDLKKNELEIKDKNGLPSRVKLQTIKSVNGTQFSLLALLKAATATPEQLSYTALDETQLRPQFFLFIPTGDIVIKKETAA